MNELTSSYFSSFTVYTVATLRKLCLAHPVSNSKHFTRTWRTRISGGKPWQKWSRSRFKKVSFTISGLETTTDHVTRISMQCQMHVCVNTPRSADPVKPGPKLNPSAGRSPAVFLALLFAPPLFSAFQSTQTQHLRKQFFLSRRETHLSELPPSFCSFMSRSPSTFLTMQHERRNRIVSLFAIVIKFTSLKKCLVEIDFCLMYSVDNIKLST